MTGTSAQVAVPHRRHPQVLHIGFSKCASTYLRSLFRGHPNIYLVFKSGFFTPFLRRDMVFTEYQALFSDDPSKVNVESDEHLTLPGVHPMLGVRTTELAEFQLVADKIKQCLPDVRIIMVIRNQASLIVSRYSEFLIQGGSLTFDEFASELTGERTGGNLYFQNFYHDIIGVLEARFPKDNLLILMQEAMRENPRETTATIGRFMSLGGELVLKKGPRSERKSLSFAGMVVLRWLNRRLVQRPSVGGDPPKSRVPQFFYQNVVRLVRALDYYMLSRFSPPSTRVLTEGRRRAIQSQFRDDSLKLEQYFGRKLGKFGYLEDV